MRLYPIGAPQPLIEHPAWGRYEAGKEDGGFDLPDELSDELHSFCHRGKRIWETEDERSERQQREGLAHRRDPAALFETVSGMADLTRQLAAVQLGQSAPASMGPEDEIAVLRRRLAELEGGAAEPEAKPEPEAGSKPEVKAPVKRGPASAKDAPAA
jgi:hypothetical protein